MAELAVSMVVGPLVSLVKEKVSNYLLEQYKVMEGMEKQHKILKRKLPAILDIMADAEKQASHREGVKAWLEELKMVAYEANDVFDEFQYEALRRKAKEEGHITKLGILAGVKLFPTHNRVVFRNRMGKKLSSIVEAIEILVAEMNAFGFKHQLERAPARKEWRETDHYIGGHEDIVRRSRDKEREKIVEILLNGQASGDDLLVVPIVGMGGLGKTTLAQLIYNDPKVQDHFKPLKWVCVSDDFDVCSLANKICNASEQTLEEALKNLQDQLGGKRYLLVLDDVWNKDDHKWEKLKASLKHGAIGSAVLTTTRDPEIAEFMGTIVKKSWINKYHDVEILDNEFIQEIIKTRAGFISLPQSKQNELASLVVPIAKRCVGSPLAAKALGSVLRNKTTKKEWEKVLQQSRICSDETKILHILKLSYDYLPSNARQCFAFCALYPKDCEIDVDNLVQLWIANGFIIDQKTVPAETLGQQIVEEMVSRSFFQYVDKDPTRFGYSSKTLLKIHDLMHDVALSAAEKECIYVTHEMIRSRELLPSTARHIHFPYTTVRRLVAMRKDIRWCFPTYNIPQTLILDGVFSKDLQHLSKFSSLRALALPMSWGSDHSTINLKHMFRLRYPDLSNSDLKHMFHLRYLDLSNSGIKSLPDNISILYNLQTLKLSGCEDLERLPKEMKYMTSLRHLYTDGCDKLKCMPPKLGHLTCLQTVTCFVVGDGSDCSSLEELKDLNIGGSLEINHLENVTEIEDAKAAKLGNKKELRQLSLRWTRDEVEEQQCHDVLEALEAPDGLLALQIQCYQGMNFPSWMGTLRYMVELRLSDCGKTEQIPPLGQLPKLHLLHLEGLKKLQFLCSSCTSSTFGELKDLKLVNLDDLGSFYPQVAERGAVAFPKLVILRIKGCKNLTALPEAAVLKEPPCGGGDYIYNGRSAFPVLKTLTLQDLRRFERWETGALETEVEQTVMFPLLETAHIWKCPQLTTSLPRAPKLRELQMRQANEEMSMSHLVAAGYMTSVSTLSLDHVKVDGEEEIWDQLSSSVTDMKLSQCHGFFVQPSPVALWGCLGQQLRDLSIWGCDELVYWPEKEFQRLVSLRSLRIAGCNRLIGYVTGQATTSEERERGQLLPCLESLVIFSCESLVHILNATSTLKRMEVVSCNKLESLSGIGKQQDKTSSLHHQGTSPSSSNDIMAATGDVREELLSPPSAARRRDINNFLPSSLEYLTIESCDGLSEVLSLPSSLMVVVIHYCSKLRSLSGQLDALKRLVIYNCPDLRSLEPCMIEHPELLECLILRRCKSLASLPGRSRTESGSGSGPQIEHYSSLRNLVIERCPGIKSLPSALLRRPLVQKDLDAHLREHQEEGLLGRICSSLSPKRLGR